MKSMRDAVSYQRGWLRKYYKKVGVLAHLVKYISLQHHISLKRHKIQFEQRHLTASHFTKAALKSAIVLQSFKMPHTSFHHIFAPSYINDI